MQHCFFFTVICLPGVDSWEYEPVLHYLQEKMVKSLDMDASLDLEMTEIRRNKLS